MSGSALTPDVRRPEGMRGGGTDLPGNRYPHKTDIAPGFQASARGFSRENRAATAVGGILIVAVARLADWNTRHPHCPARHFAL